MELLERTRPWYIFFLEVPYISKYCSSFLEREFQPGWSKAINAQALRVHYVVKAKMHILPSQTAARPFFIELFLHLIMFVFITKDLN